VHQHIDLLVRVVKGGDGRTVLVTPKHSMVGCSRCTNRRGVTDSIGGAVRLGVDSVRAARTLSVKSVSRRCASAIASSSCRCLPA
jgi:hypothetical protein